MMNKKNSTLQLGARNLKYISHKDQVLPLLAYFCISPDPLEIQKQMISHLKTLMCGYLEPEGLEHGCTKKWQHPPNLKKTTVSVKMSFLGKMAIRLCSHALIFLVPINHILGHSNEISFVFKFQVDLEKHKNKLKMEGPAPYVK